MTDVEVVPPEGKTSFSGIPQSQFIDDVAVYMKVEIFFPVWKQVLSVYNIPIYFSVFFWTHRFSTFFNLFFSCPSHSAFSWFSLCASAMCTEPSLGGVYIWVHIRYFFPPTLSGSFIFSSLATFRLLTPIVVFLPEFFAILHLFYPFNFPFSIFLSSFFLYFYFSPFFLFPLSYSFPQITRADISSGGGRYFTIYRTLLSWNMCSSSITSLLFPSFSIPFIFQFSYSSLFLFLSYIPTPKRHQHISPWGSGEGMSGFSDMQKNIKHIFFFRDSGTVHFIKGA